jgi:hypothetical protein
MRFPLGLVVLPGLALATAFGQSPMLLSGPARCQECRIELEQVVVLGDSAGPGMLREQASIATDQRGRFYINGPYDPAILVFDARGRFLQRIGRQGQGPGEFAGAPIIFFGGGDTLYALDRARLTVFSPEYKLVRTATLGLSYSSVVRLPDGHFLLSGSGRTPESIGYPLHLIDETGAHVRSFGSATGAKDLPSAPDPSIRRLAAPVGQSVWSVKLTQLVLEQWTFGGKQLTRITRDAPWFPRNIQMPRGGTDGTHPSPPWIGSVSQDKAGLLWTLTIVPDREWRPRTLPQHPGGGTYTPDSLRHKIHDSVLEVIDPERRVVLATRTFDTLFKAFIAPGLLASYTEDASGNPRYVIWRTRLVSPFSK